MGGNARGFGALVSETVTYTDPAFPNLEFHRRAAMDRAGYFMPGYKPRVSSSGTIVVMPSFEGAATLSSIKASSRQPKASKLPCTE